SDSAGNEGLACSPEVSAAGISDSVPTHNVGEVVFHNSFSANSCLFSVVNIRFWCMSHCSPRKWVTGAFGISWFRSLWFFTLQPSDFWFHGCGRLTQMSVFHSFPDRKRAGSNRESGTVLRRGG